jgi:predicted CXXCH cytochrome family protein
VSMANGSRTILVIALLGLPVPGPIYAEEAADMFDCKVCHPMKIRDFKGRRANPIVPIEEFPEEPTGKQDIASTSGMCLSCHDGFVADSREVWKDGYSGHRLGMAPGDGLYSSELDGAPEFPLNEDGRIYCGTCHSAHLNEAEGAPKKVKPFMRASHQGGNVCQGCHRDKQAIADTGHDKGSRRARDFERRGTCGTCHAAHGSEFAVMWARSRGQGNHVVNTLCRSCHEEGPEPGDHPARIVAWSQPLRQGVRSNAAAAMPVHDDGGRSADVGRITCATCHDVHRERATDRRDDLPGLHLRLPEVAEPLCADCHGHESLFLYTFFHSVVSR